MAKKVFIGVLAALMLFAFVACDNGNTAGGTISYIEATANVDYLVGETPDPADWSFTGYYVDGTPVTIPSTQFVLDSADFSAAGEKKATFTWTSGGRTVAGETTVYAADSIAVAVADDAKTTYYTTVSGTGDNAPANFQKISTTGITVTATYDGDKTKEVEIDAADCAIGTLSNGKFTERQNAWTGTDYESSTNDFVIQVTVGGKSATYDIEFLKNGIVSLDFDIDDDLVFYYGEGEKSNDVTLSEYTDMISVVATYSNEQQAEISGTGLQLTVQASTDNADPIFTNAKTEISQLTLPAEATGVKFSARYTGADAASSYVPTPVTSKVISVLEDEAVGIFAYGESTGAAADVTVGLDKDYTTDAADTVSAKAAPTNLVVKFVMASDELLERAESAMKINNKALNFTQDSDPDDKATKDYYVVVTEPFEKEDGYYAGLTQSITIQALGTSFECQVPVKLV